MDDMMSDSRPQSPFHRKLVMKVTFDSVDSRFEKLHLEVDLKETKFTIEDHDDDPGESRRLRSEIRDPNCNCARVWLGMFDTTIEATKAYDRGDVRNAREQSDS
ncbi:AP2/ERF domain-containing protein [Cynara cardunculus var. scolymus]|uniref:AP2/ERF domain-containing protein n=1 Tax=Cynara cardunculus var. scolymus TaxID=59895 RepID=A0A103Y5Q1_CYNCS|nr:AP2/ERF domain-containing protein [Cynara cardunculus var. scolymus]